MRCNNSQACADLPTTGSTIELFLPFIVSLSMPSLSPNQTKNSQCGVAVLTWLHRLLPFVLPPSLLIHLPPAKKHEQSLRILHRKAKPLSRSEMIKSISLFGQREHFRQCNTTVSVLVLVRGLFQCCRFVMFCEGQRLREASALKQ